MRARQAGGSHWTHPLPSYNDRHHAGSDRQTGPEQRFVYVIDQNQQVKVQPIKLIRSQNDMALIEGVVEGTRIVKEGGQNLRPGGKVVEASQPAKVKASAAQGSK